MRYQTHLFASTADVALIAGAELYLDRPRYLRDRGEATGTGAVFDTVDASVVTSRTRSVHGE